MDQAKKRFLDQVKGGLIVSCQALEGEPLHGSFIMSRMARAAMMGGAVGIRANTVEDIAEIKKEVPLPVIGIIKQEYPDSQVYISPTIKEISALAECGVSVIATDATRRTRPGGRTLEEFFSEIRRIYPCQLFMADCSDYQEAMAAAEMGFDLVGTTLRGYTEYTREAALPDMDLIRRLARDCKKPVVAEGGIQTPEQLKAVLEAGAWTAVVGGAITRPAEITKRFVAAVPRQP